MYLDEDLCCITMLIVAMMKSQGLCSCIPSPSVLASLIMFLSQSLLHFTD